MSRFLISLDPGTRHMGAAWFVDGELVTATHIQPDVALRSKGPVTWLHLGAKLKRWTRNLAWDCHATTPDFAFEMMVIRKRSEKPAKDLPGICAVVGVCLKELAPTSPFEYTPEQWNKSRKKPPNHLRIWNHMTSAERQNFLVDTKHTRITFENLIDREVDTEGKKTLGQLEHALEAVGIGLHHLGRLN